MSPSVIATPKKPSPMAAVTVGPWESTEKVGCAPAGAPRSAAEKNPVATQSSDRRIRRVLSFQ
jgi:hypothetical protein